jgi:hypothetical protein
MAVLARLGDSDPAARPFGLLLLSATVSALVLGSLALIALHVIEPESLGEPGHDVQFLPGGEARLTFMMGLLALSGATTMLGLFRTVREAVRDVIPVDPTLYSHALGLATAIAVTLIPLLPLFVLGKPPLPLPPNAMPSGSAPIVLPSFSERAVELGWFAMASLIAAGPGAGRSWPALRSRLGLTRPAWWQLGVALIAGAALTFARPHAVAVIGSWMNLAAEAPTGAWLPQNFSWPVLVFLSVLAVLGTELTYLGYLQPRLGIVLTNLILTAPLAWTATWNTLFVAFGAGLVLSGIRNLGGTIAAAAGHLVFLLGTGWMMK